ncbi:TraG family conjugative transposon ATPase [Sediminibacterium ginsengisoli]|uniref:Bacteroides conjugation system ATPase, TraG family n=1 Tax=Sediminibacterium ginsengisoli TaxID=413434 RepID=A0A1T4NXI1_9BACT|nr:TraG family conjugative transposon ATPase [Sediminibacterium ginsengisoli]SJZ83762.1 Bacteroides conjugation system ATPase, TraG family [Sediminibacterium ginsengisoli]
MKQLSDILPLYGVEHDMLLSKMGAITICYRLQLPEIFTISDPDYETIHQSWVKALKLLPVGCVIHKQDWYLQQQYDGDFERDLNFLERSSECFFHERPYLDHNCYLLITLKPADCKPVNSYFSTLLRKHLVPTQTKDPAFIKMFEGVCAQFIKVLSDSGLMSCERLGNTQIVALVNRYLILSDDGVLRDLSFESGIRIGEKYCELFTLADTEDLPTHCGPRIDYEKYSMDCVRFPVGFSAALGQLLPCDHIFSQYLVVEDTGGVQTELERKRRKLQSLSAYSRGNAFAKEAVSLFLNESVVEGKQIVSAHFNVLAWTDEAARLSMIRDLCSSAFAKLGATARIETLGAPQLFWSGIPGNAGDLPVNETFLTFSGQACCLLNVETNYISSISPFGIRLGDRISGRPLHIDLSDEPMKHGITTNRNKIIIGPSGSGKSFFTNHLTRSYHAQGTHVVIVDVGHSYKGLCELTRGYYFTFSEDEPISFNPFYVGQDETLDIEKKESVKTLLVALWKKDDERFTRSEYVALSNALQLYYDSRPGFPCFNSFYEFLQTEFVAVLERDKVKDRDFDVANFLYVLRPYYRGGEFDYLLNATANLDLLQQPFIVFELDNIKDHPILFPVVTIIIMDVFISKMRKLKGVRKQMLIEEAWKAVAKNGMAEYIKYLFKTARKHFAEAIVVTQEIEDILSSEIIKQAIVNNADYKILLDQRKYQNRFSEIQQLLGLPDSEVPKILSMNKANDPLHRYKEVYIWPLRKVYRVEVSAEEYLTYTTEEAEKLAVSNAAAIFGGMEAAIKSIVSST